MKQGQTNIVSSPVLTLCQPSVRSEFERGIFDYRAHRNSKLGTVQDHYWSKSKIIKIKAKHAKARNEKKVTTRQPHEGMAAT